MIKEISAGTLLVLVAAVSAFMAKNTLTTRRMLPFHEDALLKKWDDLESNLKLIMMALTRFLGIGFLISTLCLLGSATLIIMKASYWQLLLITVPIIFNSALALINYALFKKTKAKTPWKESIIALFVIIIALLLAIF